MGFVEVLTILFIGLKLTGHIDWSWWLVLLPEIIVVVLYGIYGALATPTYRRRR